MLRSGTDCGLLVFTKPERPGRVKTRLIGDLRPKEAAQLHAAFRDDLLERLAGGPFDLTVAWALEPGDPLPESEFPALRQQGEDLGERLHRALADVARSHGSVAAVGSDHPLLRVAAVVEAFERLESGADVALGPATDGGYYLIAVRAESLSRRLFEAIPWSTERVFEQTLARCRETGLSVELLPEDSDVDTPADLERLARDLRAADAPPAPRTHALLERWGRLAPETHR